MARSMFPLLLLGGAAVVLAGSASKKKKKTSKSSEDSEKDAEDVINEVDDEEKQEEEPTTSEPAKGSGGGGSSSGPSSPGPSLGPSTGEVTPSLVPSRPPKMTPSGPTPRPPAPKGPTPPSVPGGGPTAPTRTITPSAPGAPQIPPPPDGPDASGTSVQSFYARKPQYIDPDVANRLGSKALTSLPEQEFYFYLTRRFQKQLFDAIRSRIANMKSGQEDPTVLSVIVREELKKINSGTPWEDDISLQHPAIDLAWDSALRLGHLASVDLGFEEPSTSELFKVKGSLYTVPRNALGMTTDSARNIEKNQRVEILATDQSLENAEHLIARVLDTAPSGNSGLFRLEIVQSFQGKNVAPALQDKHGFKVGQKASFSKNAPTGIYRIFPRGMV